MNLLNAGCGTHYANGWVNTDVWESDTTKPDVKVEPGQPYPFDDHTFDAVFLGHVLEHIEWSLVPSFMMDINRVAKPGAPMLIVGPDVYRTINRWKDGSEPWFMVESVLEHQDVNWQPDRQHEWWDGATHHWNCHESRVVALLNRLKFPDIEVLTESVTAGDGWKDLHNPSIKWPTIAYSPWQFAIRCTAHSG